MLIYRDSSTQILEGIGQLEAVSDGELEFPTLAGFWAHKRAGQPFLKSVAGIAVAKTVPSVDSCLLRRGDGIDLMA